MSNLTYHPYNKQSFAVIGDRAKYGNLMKTIGGRWNSKLKGGPGWTVPIANEAGLKKIITAMSTPEETETVKARKNYHRAISEPTDSEASDKEQEPKGSAPPKDTTEQPAEQDVHDEPQPENNDAHDAHDKPQQSQNDEQPKRDPGFEDEMNKKRREEERRRFEDDRKAYENKKRDAERQPRKQERRREEPRKEEPRKEERRREEPRKEEPRREERRREERREEPRKEERRVRKEDRHDHERRHDRRQHTPDERYYRSFAEKPSRFRALYEPSDDDEDGFTSSSSDGSSSSDEFPVPESPKRRTTAKSDTEHLRSKIRLLEKELEAARQKDKKHNKRA